MKHRNKFLNDIDDSLLIKELEKRGYKVYDEDEYRKKEEDFYQLYLTYRTCSLDFFLKKLERFYEIHI
jgi:hypothetical protein